MAWTADSGGASPLNKKPRIRRNARWGWECGHGIGWTGHGSTPKEAWINWSRWTLWPIGRNDAHGRIK